LYIYKTKFDAFRLFISNLTTMRKCILWLFHVCILCFFLNIAYAQNPKVVHGSVQDEKGNKIEGASVSEKKNPKNGTTTNKSGDFVITLKGITNTIEISFIGYQNYEAKVIGDRITATLKPIDNNLDVVVIGYQSVKRRNTTAAISTVQGKDIQDIPEASFDQMLQGRVAGVSVLSSTGEPGSAPRIVIRGATNVDYKSENGVTDQPLYVIDGVIYDVNGIGTAYQNNNPLSLIDPNDIESIDILKDASASAIYGSRAGNGVIVVKTKRPRTGKPQISFSTYGGVVTRPNFRSVTTGAKERALKLALINNGLDYNNLAMGNTPLALTDSLNPAFNNDVDWQGLLIRSNAYVNSEDVGIAGYSGSSNYRLSVNHYNEQGLLNGYSLDRVSPHLMVTINPLNKLSITADILLSSQRNHHGLGVPNQFFLNSSTFPSSFTQLNPTQVSTFKGQTNPFDDDRIFAFNAALRITDTITRNLLFNSSYSANNYIDRWDYFSPALLNNFANTAYNVETSAPYWNFENYLTYAKSFREHSLAIVLGEASSFLQNNSTNASASGISSSGIYTLQSVPPGPYLSANTSKEEKTTASYYGRISYDYKGKYLLNAAFRRDASSIYSSSYRWATFPSIAAGWIVSDEDFFNSAKKIINFFKIRASYGITGFDPGNYYAKFQQLYPEASYNGSTTGTPYNNGSPGGGIGGTPVTYNGTSAISPFPYGNYSSNSGVNSSTSVRWEKYPQVDVGTDIEFFKGRIGFVFDWYRKDAIDKYFWNVDAQPTTGYAFYSGNFVNVRNTGLEFAFNSRNFSSKSKFQWNTSFNISFNKNYVTKLPNGDRDFNFGPEFLQSTLSIGEPLFQYKVWQVNGVYSTTKDVPVDPITGKTITFFGAPLTAGDPRRIDQNGDYVIDYNDKVIGGDPNPKATGGFSNTFSYKGVTLDVFCSFVLGRTIQNGYLSDGLNGSSSYTSWGNNAGPAGFTNILNKFWQKPGDQTEFPRLVTPVGSSVDPWDISNSFFLENGSFLKIKQVKLSYRLPGKWMRSMGMRNFDVYGLVENLHIFTKSTVPDPELVDPTTGYANTVYPTSLKFTLGLHIEL
jgi:TonB-linked SusC/RagA family outer membrane protein